MSSSKYPSSCSDWPHPLCTLNTYLRLHIPYMSVFTYFLVPLAGLSIVCFVVDFPSVLLVGLLFLVYNSCFSWLFISLFPLTTVSNETLQSYLVVYFVYRTLYSYLACIRWNVLYSFLPQLLFIFYNRVYSSNVILEESASSITL